VIVDRFPRPSIGELVGHVDEIAGQLALALVGLESDRMALPEHLAVALTPTTVRKRPW
jgi:hypothetical protein